MTANKNPRPCIQQARKEHRCIISANGADARALSRLYLSGKLLRPHQGTYAEPEIWNALNLRQRSVALSKALALQHPDWVFAGISAAAIQRLPHRDWLHRNECIYVTSNLMSYTSSKRKIQHIRAPTNEYVVIDALRTTSLERTLLDCGARYAFRDVLAMYDYALRQHLTTKNDIAEAVTSLPQATGETLARLHALLEYASPLSESVGESLCRGTMLEEGFPAPHQQTIHTGRMHNAFYRTDFEFTAADGSIIIVEFDGAQKYVDPSMTGNRTIREVVHREQERERTLAAEPNVRQIIRFDYDQVMQRTPVVQALVATGVPRKSVKPPFAHSSI